MDETQGPTWVTLSEPRSSSANPSEELDELRSASPTERQPTTMSQAPRKKRKAYPLIDDEDERRAASGTQRAQASSSSTRLHNPLDDVVKKKKKKKRIVFAKTPEPVRAPEPLQPLERPRRRASDLLDSLSATQVQGPTKPRPSLSGKKNKNLHMLSSDDEAAVVPVRVPPRPISNGQSKPEAPVPPASQRRPSFMASPSTFLSPSFGSSSNIGEAGSSTVAPSMPSQTRQVPPPPSRADRSPLAESFAASAQNKRKRRRSSPTQASQWRKSGNSRDLIDMSDDDAPLPRPQPPASSKRPRRSSPSRSPVDVIEILDSEEEVVPPSTQKSRPPVKKSPPRLSAVRKVSHVSFREDPDGTIVISDDDEEDDTEEPILNGLPSRPPASKTQPRASHDTPERRPSTRPVLAEPLPEGPPTSREASEGNISTDSIMSPIYSSPAPDPDVASPGSADAQQEDEPSAVLRESPQRSAASRKPSGTTVMQMQMESLALDTSGTHLSQSPVPSLLLPDSSQSEGPSSSQIHDAAEEDISCLSQTAEKQLQIVDNDTEVTHSYSTPSRRPNPLTGMPTAEQDINSVRISALSPQGKVASPGAPATSNATPTSHPAVGSPLRTKHTVPRRPLYAGSDGFFKDIYKHQSRSHSSTKEVASSVPAVFAPAKPAIPEQAAKAHTGTTATIADNLTSPAKEPMRVAASSVQGSPNKGTSHAQNVSSPARNVADPVTTTAPEVPPHSITAGVQRPHSGVVASPTLALTPSKQVLGGSLTVPGPMIPVKVFASPTQGSSRPVVASSASEPPVSETAVIPTQGASRSLTEIINSAVKANHQMRQAPPPDSDIIDLTMDEDDIDLSGISLPEPEEAPNNVGARHALADTTVVAHLPASTGSPVHREAAHTTEKSRVKPPSMRAFLNNLRDQRQKADSTVSLPVMEPPAVTSSTLRSASPIAASSDVTTEPYAAPLVPTIETRVAPTLQEPSRISRDLPRSTVRRAEGVATLPASAVVPPPPLPINFYEDHVAEASPLHDLEMEHPASLFEVQEEVAEPSGEDTDDRECLDMLTQVETSENKVSDAQQPALHIRTRSISSGGSADDDTGLPIALRRQKRSSRLSSRSSSATNLSPGPITPRDDTSIVPEVRVSRGTSSDDQISGHAPLRLSGEFELLTWDKDLARVTAKEFADTFELAANLPHEIQDRLNAMHIAGRRADNMQAKIFEAVISENTADDEPFAPSIRIVNEVDDELTPPCEFHYSNLMWHGEGVPTPDLANLHGCDCIGPCNPKSKTCACVRRQEAYSKEAADGFLYDGRGRLRVHEYPIFECNMFCKCSEECSNRVVQHGRKYPVTIQKTRYKGWGVFAGNRKIPANTYIGVYAGEYLTDSQGEMRGMKYNKFGRTYLFDIDFYFLKGDDPDDWHNKYCIDAYHAGNFTRYLNHSCEPNCHINACFINEGSIEKPLLAIFTCRDVDPGEELCFSYFGMPDDDEEVQEDEGESKNANDGVYVPCRCGTKKCKGKMWK